MPMPEFHELVNEAKKEIREISSEDLKKMQSSGDDFTLIDVREREDAEKGTIPGAVNVPRGILEHSRKWDSKTQSPWPVAIEDGRKAVISSWHLALRRPGLS